METASPRELKRLGRNVKGYCGETIDIDVVVSEVVCAAGKRGWVVDQIDAGAGLTLPALRRPGKGEGPRIYISAGIHGDEPAGPLAALELVRADNWPAPVQLWLCPCLNPVGYRVNRRENGAGLDLNRQYLNSEAAEARGHIRWLEQQPAFDLCLCLHEDWEANGFYLYELNPDGQPSRAEAMVAAAAEVCPVDYSEVIEGRAACGGIIRPNLDPRSRPQWPEAFYLLMHKTRLSYTLEAPSDWPLGVRVAALVAGVRAGVKGNL